MQVNSDGNDEGSPVDVQSPGAESVAPFSELVSAQEHSSPVAQSDTTLGGASFQTAQVRPLYFGCQVHCLLQFPWACRRSCTKEMSATDCA